MSRNRLDAAAQALADADDVILQQIDQARATVQPEGVGKLHVVGEYEANGEVQVETYLAEGLAAAQAHAVKGAGLETLAVEAEHLIQASRIDVVTAQEQHLHASRTLGHFARRDRFALLRYLLGWSILGLGDTAGILGAAILLGEIPYIALGQALATGFAAVTSGQAGADLKDLRMARQRRRDFEELSDDEQRYRHLFSGMEAGVTIMKMVGWISATIIVIITVGIFSLRLSVEGMASGLAFGTLAGATALGSFISTYSYTDDIADYIAATERVYRKARTEHLTLANAPSIRQRAEAMESARSIEVEYSHRGRAAWWQLRSLSQRILRRNPGVAGHGTATEQPETFGRLFRGDAA